MGEHNPRPRGPVGEGDPQKRDSYKENAGVRGPTGVGTHG